MKFQKNDLGNLHIMQDGIELGMLIKHERDTYRLSTKDITSPMLAIHGKIFHGLDDAKTGVAMAQKVAARRQGVAS